MLHGRPWHPQTQGKVERLHRTLGLEAGDWWNAADLAGCQGRFDTWRMLYNQERPHEALGMAVPASRYVPSARTYPQQLPPIDYGPGATVRTIPRPMAGCIIRGDAIGSAGHSAGNPWRCGQPAPTVC